MDQDSRYATRANKATKIIAILHDFLGSNLSEKICLDIGCSNGAISNRIASQFKLVIGIDVDLVAVYQAEANRIDNNIAFSIGDGTYIPVPNNYFDIVICAQVYEHTDNQDSLANEIWRVLQPNGVCFFSGPNRFSVIEEHYWLPFLSWFPQPLSNLYMRIFRRGNFYDIKPRNYWQIRHLWRAFSQYDYTIPMLKEPHRFNVEKNLGNFSWIGKLPIWVIKIFMVFFPNYNWILVKS